MTEYQLLDSGDCRKLEQAGSYRLIRPALNAFWKPALPRSEWEQAAGVFTRDASGGGTWEWRRKRPESWVIEWGGLKLKVRATNFGHLGFFAEQRDNWDWFRKVIPQLGAEVATLNLFGYSGAGSLALAAAGARVTHLDAARGMNEWGRENLELNSQIPDSIRWITDDVQKFVTREIRRGGKYNGIVLDPPTFGRGAKGQIWKIDQYLMELLQACRRLKADSGPFFVVLSCHSPGYSPLVLERLLTDAFGGGEIYGGEMTIPESSGRMLPAGNYARLRING
ncbi:MAG: class I SAM-dependent methyltransferase [Victivallaceae bacterium]|nr:class I SAM-dependent methyltransferase [Victivallaceae bacterium]